MLEHWVWPYFLACVENLFVARGVPPVFLIKKSRAGRPCHENSQLR
jgi:hypothetical protein